MRLALGLDTSCYTTSLAAVDEAGRIIHDERAPLVVAPGERGLRQSEALFQHLRQAEPLLAAWRASAGAGERILAVGASTRPRPVDGSYLPVFLAGTTLGQALAAGAGAPFYAASHQEGHLRAALHEVAAPPASFLGVHLSGGTTEVLRVARNAAGFDLSLLGGTEDLHAGQFIDRLGLAMGLPFPAGPAFERLAAQGRPGILRLPVAARGLRLSLSGPLSAAERALRDGTDRADLAAAALVCLSESVARLLQAALAKTGLRDVVLGGGVSANRQLREALTKAFPEVGLTFAAPRLASDNAVGVALLALDWIRAQPGPTVG